MTKILKPEKIKPGLHVCIDFRGNGYFYERGEVIKKLRKNWLVNIPKRDLSYIGGVNGNYSVPPNRLRLDVSFTKEGRPLMATKEDSQYAFSKEHINYFNSMTMEKEEGATT
tara:strand:+ start:390 stop:725 length:336 start_codon:yes stop_codon:yes gene_type:complete